MHLCRDDAGWLPSFLIFGFFVAYILPLFAIFALPMLFRVQLGPLIIYLLCSEVAGTIPEVWAIKFVNFFLRRLGCLIQCFAFYLLVSRLLCPVPE